MAIQIRTSLAEPETEGFVPHLGHGFPREDVLTPALGPGVVRSLKS